MTSLSLEPGLVTVSSLLRYRAAERGERMAFVFLADGESEAERLTYGELDWRARAVAAALRQSLGPGDRALLLYPPGLEFIAAFFGCLYAGVIAVPAYPPRRGDSTQGRLRSIVRDAAPRAVLTMAGLSDAASFVSRAPELAVMRWIATDVLEGADAEPADSHPGAVAFLQYTSGSTGTPKGVMVTHANLLHNERMIREVCRHDESMVMVGWLPLYHDMGLIGNVLQPIYAGGSCVLMAPVAFLQKPVRWLEAISRYRGHTSGGPNFAYELCLRRVGEEERRRLDLRSWRVAFNGAEPVRAETLERFAAAFASCGFRREALYPCYGLAEATLFVTGGEHGRAPRSIPASAAALDADRWEPPAPGEARRELVSCGRTWSDLEVEIVDPETRRACAPGRIGEIWVRGASVAQGYWNRPETTASEFRARRIAVDGCEEGPYLRTGDLGFFQDGELFVAGRRKDLIILRGRNHYPQDIEKTVEEAHPALRPGCGAAFSVEVEGEERLVLTCEVERRPGASPEEIAAAVRRAVAEEYELSVHEVVLLRIGTVPKTSSGKIQRHACRAGYLDGTLAVVGRVAAALPAAAAAFSEEGLDRRTLLALDPDERLRLLTSWLHAAVAGAARLPAARIDPAQPLVRQGLDSLAAVELQQGVEEALGVSLSPGELLDSGSLGELAERLLAAMGETVAAAARPAAAAEIREAPLSDGQKALWFLHRLAPDSAAYNIAGAARVRDLRPEALRRALIAVAARHPALRTTFHPGDPEPLQRVREEPEIDFVTEDAAAWSDGELLERLHAAAWRPFDLERGPLLRLAVFSRSAAEHALVLAVHHVVADLWSIAVLVRELGAFYREETGGPAASLEPLAAGFAAHVLRQRELADGPVRARSWEHWRAQLAPPLPVLELSTDRLRPPLQTYSGTVATLWLDPGLSGRIAALARSRDATLYVVLLAAFHALLHRLTGQEDLLVGSPTAGRGSRELAGVVGYFVNPVVLRAAVSGGQPFEDLLERVRRTALDAFAHQEIPFLRLAERLHPERDPGRSPLFQAMFMLQRAPRPEEQALAAFALGLAGARLEVGGLTLESLPLEERSSQLDLSLTMAELPAGLAAALQVNADLFDAATARRMLAGWRVFLDGLTAEPGRPVGDLPLLTEEERAQVLGALAEGGAARSGPLLHEAVAAWAAAAPEAPALLATAAGEEGGLVSLVSYGELCRRFARLAHHLREMGVGPEAPVGILLDRSPEAIVALLGVLAAGGACLPLDPAHPAGRLAELLAGSGAEVLLTRRSLLARLGPVPGVRRVVDLEMEAEAISRRPDTPPAAAVLPGHLAYVLHTSGSTGKPKRVGLEHRSLAAYVAGMAEVWGVGPGDRVLQFASLGFDTSIEEIFLALGRGAALVLRDEEMLASTERFFAAAGRCGVTVMSLPTAFWHQLASDLGVAGPAPPAPLRLLVLGGETARADRLARWQRHGGPRIQVLNTYGPTESTVAATVSDVTGPQAADVPIGRPVAGIRCRILSPRLQPVPVGVAGELYLGGAGLARGYLGQPDRTAERFVPDPWATAPGERLYRTGDRTRFLPDGTLLFYGRVDDQVKIRGVRVEPGEVEKALAAHPAVRDAVVVARQDAAGEVRLVAYAVPTGTDRPSVAELRSYLVGRLPEALVPAALVVLDEIPLTPNGKVDRRRLPEPERPSGVGGRAPSTPLEEVLAEIWKSLLDVKRVGLDDNFFALGGHSLLATRLTSRVAAELGVDLPLAAVFTNTLGELARRVEAAVAREPPGPPARRRASAEGAPLSYAQERLWVLDQLAPGSPAYNMPATARLEGALDLPAFRRTLSEIVRRHEMLRTTFHGGSRGPRQYVMPAWSVPLPEIDLSALPTVACSGEAGRLARDEARRPFDLAAGPLLRAALLRLAPGERVLVANLHHIAADGWSIDVLLREAAVLYSVFARGLPSPLPELLWQYADFAVWQREHLRGAELDRQIAWWRERLSGAPSEPALPVDLPPGPVPGSRGALHGFSLSPALDTALRELADRHGATLFMVLLAGCTALLHRWSGEDDISVGSPVANRSRPEVQDLIGFFVNTLVLRTHLTGRLSSAGLLDQVRETALGAYTHQEVPFERLVEALRPERALGREPFFQVMFSLQNAGTPTAAGELALRPEEIDTGIARWPVAVELAEEDGYLAGRLRYRTDRFHATTIARLAERFRILLEGMAAAPERPVAELPLLARAERQQILVEWNDTAWGEGEEHSVPELFNAQAERRPEAVALSCGEEELTYRELGERIHRLAHHLRRLGVGPEVRVGLCVERSPDLVVSLLGVLAAGGAFVPLDPAAPAERLSHLLRDAGAAFLVTREPLAARLSGHGARPVFLDADAVDIARAPAARPGWHPAPGDAAYLIYTSGTTGGPKAVLVEHGSLSHTLAASRWLFGWTEQDRMPCLAPFSFDIALFELLNPLLAGGECVLVPHEPTLDLAAVAAALPRLTRLHSVPAVLRELIRTLRATAVPSPERLGGPRTLFVGGEAVPADLLAEMRETFPAAAIHVLYGPTEGTIICASHAVPDGPPEPRLFLGRPLPGVTLAVFEPGGEPAPVGVAGELCIAGPGVARGYLGREELTAERFVQRGGLRLYRTGDRARWLPNGTLEFLGRLDQQVKVRGIRIEPGEVEAALLRHPGLRHAVVEARGEGIERRLVAWVVPARLPAPTADELRSFLRAILPEHLVPGAFVSLEELPLTPHGKVDRRALPEPAPAARSEAATAPRTPAEEIVAGVWSELLGRERIGPEESFFELGGHSLLATRVASRLSAVFGIEVPLRWLFETPVLADLTRRIEAAAACAMGVVRPPLTRASRDLPLPMSFAQQRLWFLDRLNPGNPVYNISSAMLLGGPLDAAALEGALTAIVGRHEALRSRFTARGGEAVQAVDPPGLCALPRVDLEGVPELERQAELRRLSREEAERSFDLEHGPLLRAVLLCLAPERHAVLLTLHHIVADGWSMGVLAREVATLYEAFSSGLASPLPELPVQYADYAVWQRQWLSGEVLERQLAWWRQALWGAEALLQLPADRPRPPVPSLRGDAVPLRVSEDTARGLAALAQGEGATLYMVLLAAFNVLLLRLSGQVDVSVGSPVANREQVEVEGLIGFFVNTLVMRTSLSGDPSMRRLLARVREAALGAWAHQDLPFEILVDDLQPVRDLSHTPLFQVLFALQNAVRQSLELPGLLVEPVVVETSGAQFDLTLNLLEDGREIRGQLEYRTDLFDRATMERIARLFTNLLAGVAAGPESCLSSLPLFAPAERDQLLRVWSQGERLPRAGRCFHEIFEEQADRTPDLVALVAGDGADRWLTYGVLDHRANRLAHHLRGLGVGPEVVVGVCSGRSQELVEAFLAILKAGGTYLPLDPSYPPERLAFLLRDSGAAVLLTDSPGTDFFTPDALSAVAVLRLDEDAPRIAARPGTRLPLATLPENAAYVIYTSGSTGHPKGVVVPHRGFCNLAVAQTRIFGVIEGDSVLQFASPSFDASVSEIGMAFAAGAALHVATREELLTLLGLLERRGITHVTLPPSVLATLPDAGLPRLRTLIVAGEDCPEALARQWGAGRRLFNAYGPTESTVCSTIGLWSGEGTLSIGVPIPNLEAFVLDAWMEPTPVGVSGELCVGGVGLARGYLGRPDLTAARWIPHPFALEPGARLYRTGDQVRFLPNGEIDFVGRLDEQVKVRGFRLEPGEIETALLGHPDLRDAVVGARGEAAERCLVAWVVPAADRPVPTSGDLRAFLRQSLPEYMVPAAFVALDALPLTPNGKVDRCALPAPEEPAGRGADAPRTPAEEIVAAVWGEVLGLARVGVEESFFGLGGHSLLVTQAASRLSAAFGWEVPLRWLFEAPTVAELARQIEGLVRQARGIAQPPLAPAPQGLPRPLSFSQQRLWFLDRLQPGNPAYNISAALRLEGPLDVAALERSLTEIVRRHEALRTRFVPVAGEAVQEVAAAATVALPVVDLGALVEPVREAELAHLARQDAEFGFDLERGPVLRATLVRLAAAQQAVLLTLHHIVADGWSMGVLVREVAALYPRFRAGHGALLPELPVQYGDFALWQRRWLQGEVLDAELAFWRGRLAGLEPLELPTDRSRPAAQGFRGAIEPLLMPPSVAAALRELGRRRGGTLFMTLLAAFQLLLWRHTGQRDLVVGSPVANRILPEIEGLIGFFVNMLVLRGDLAGEPTLGDLLERVRNLALEAYVHQDLPFEKLVEELRPERRLSSQPLFQVALVLNAAPPALDLPGLVVSPVAVDPSATQFDLILEIQEAQGCLRGHIRYRTELFDRVTVARFALHLETLLAGLAGRVDRPVRDLPWLPEAERHQMQVEWNDTASACGRERTISELFAEQAAAAPDAVAVIAGESSLSYGELRERAGQLARRLCGTGVRRGDIVGLSTGRSPELVIGMLGILEAGAAYLPLDAALPRERLALLIREAGVCLALVDPDREGVFTGLVERVARVDGDGEVESGPLDQPDALDLAYVMYTSGSTGVPKGVAVPHRAVVRLVRETGYARFGRDEVFLQLASVSFDASTLEIWGPLLNGGSLVLYQGAPASPTEIGNALVTSGITSLWLTAGLFQSLVEESLSSLGGLRQLLAGGDVLPVSHVRQVRAAHPHLRLINGYGPTENTTFTCCETIGVVGEAPVPIGRPIANTRVWVLDGAMEPVPLGGVGELYVGGDGLARGYLGRPDLTAERFLPIPGKGETSGSLYRTGDRVRWRADGRLDFLGRLDEQVKIRGFRIEPGEAEAALLRHPQVRAAVVVARGEGAAEKRLIAWVVPQALPGPDVGALRSFLRESLPEPLVPSAFVLIEALPLTPNGKVDRRALPSSGKEAPDPGTAAPRTPTEEILAGIWSEVLGCGRLGVEESFFDLGGHSLLATQVVTRMSAALGLEVPLRWLFETPTIAELARQIDESARRAGGVTRPPLLPAPRDRPLPLSFAQQRIWFLDRLEPGSSSYNVPVAIRFDGGLDAGLLAWSLGAIVQRHEALRTRFVLAGSEPVQVINPSGAVELPRVDLRSLPEDARPAESARLAAAEARRPFDLERGPVFRVLLLCTGAEEHRLVLTFHHVVADGWSMGILVRELTELYGAGVFGRVPELPELPVQYADFAVWQRSWLRGETLDEQLAYWRAQLAGAPAELPLAVDRRRPKHPTFRARGCGLTLAPDLVASLRELSRRERSTLFMVLLASFQTLLARCSGQTDLVVGTPIAARGHEAVEGLIGCFANTLALRVDLAGNPSFREVLERVRRATLDAYAHQDLPFEKLVAALRPERSQGRNPLFAVFFALQNTPLAPLELPGLRVAVEDLETGIAKFDLVLSLAEAPDGLRGGLEYDAEIFEAATIDGLLGQYETLLRAVVQDPEARIARIPLTRSPVPRRRALPADLERLLERI